MEMCLVGSGEYTEAMRAIDRELLARFERQPARVALIPTAAGLEKDVYKWILRGAAHFRKLGAEVAEILARNHAEANDKLLAEVVRNADLIYLSGGKPDHLLDSLKDSLLWQAIRKRLDEGAILAGASAGAMILGELLLYNPYGMKADQERPRFEAAFSLIPGTIILPHFDKFIEEMGEKGLAAVLEGVPEELTVVGIDEDTALVSRPDGWVVRGKGAVTLRRRGHSERFRAGSVLRSLKLSSEPPPAPAGPVS